MSESSDESKITSHRNPLRQQTDGDRFDSLPEDGDDMINDATDARSKAAVGILGHFPSPDLAALSISTNFLEVGANAAPNDKQSGGSVLAPPARSAREFLISSDEVAKSAVTKLSAPPRPDVLLPCHFRTIRDLDGVVQQIRSLFDIDYQDEINYELVDHECCFNGVYVRGSRYCDFKIRLYLDSSSAGSTTNQTSSKPLLVELQRVHRDSCGIVFKQIFGAVKRCINSSHSFSEASPHSTAEIPEEGEIGTHGLAIDVSSNDFSSCSQLSEDEIVLSIQQVLTMAKETESEQSRLEAARILCDLADEPEFLDQMKAAGCIEVLIRLMRSPRVLLRQHAVIALAQLSVHVGCAPEIIKIDMALPNLMKIALNLTLEPSTPSAESTPTEPPYKTKTMRLEAARIVKNVAEKEPALALESLKTHAAADLEAWSAQIEKIDDDNIKYRCQTALDLIRRNA